jgi:hypothetical protein
MSAKRAPERRWCPWCHEHFMATGWQLWKGKRYCSQQCAASAQCITKDHYKAMGAKGRQAQALTQTARWAAKVDGMTALEAYRLGRAEGYKLRANLDYRRKVARRQAA